MFVFCKFEENQYPRGIEEKIRMTRRETINRVNENETNKQKILKIFKDKLNDSYVREMNNLIKSIKNNSSSELSIEKCMNTQSIINTMHKSLLSNKREVIKQ